MIPPETKYAKSGEVYIAYQVLGDGPLDLVYVPGWISHVEYGWEHPLHARFLERLASFARLILFDKRGTGLSDRVAENELPTLEQRMDDVRAVMDAVGSQRAALLGASEGGNLSVLFAATYPERTIALITFGIFAKRVWAPEYPWAPTPDERQQWLESVEQDWGGPQDLETLAPSMADDEQFRRWFATYLRLSASPTSAVALGRMNTQIDIRSVLPIIRVPTLVLHRQGDRETKIEEGRYIANQIPGARFVELPGRDHLVFVGRIDEVLGEVEEFLTGVRSVTEQDRVLKTVLFTDIVNATVQVAEMDDQRWRDLLQSHHAVIRLKLDQHRGSEIKTTGDGFLATFDGPARAIRCACGIRDAVGQLGIKVRAGLHSGEVEVVGNDIGGIAVHLAARVMATAGAGEVLVSSTVKDLVAGSGIQFEDRGMYRLKGIPDEWRLLAVTGC